jgi:hypothetical protein
MTSERQKEHLRRKESDVIYLQVIENCCQL